MYTYEEAMKYTSPTPPMYWKAVGGDVIRDGFATKGRRIHFVGVGVGDFNGEVVGNAYIFTLRE